jgi:hypothetical protein
MPKLKQDGRHCLKLFPAGCGNRLWLYAIGYENGTVKLGMTSAPRSRLLLQWKWAAWAHLAGTLHFNSLCRSAERYALDEAKKHGTSIGRTERFEGLSKADAIACLRAGIQSVLDTDHQWRIEDPLCTRHETPLSRSWRLAKGAPNSHSETAKAES